MTEFAAPSVRNSNLARRHRAERRFRLYGMLALGFAGQKIVKKYRE